MTDTTIRGHAREAILAAAIPQFNALGIRAVSADRVIALAGVSKVTFYRHFPSKEALVVAYLEAELARVQAVVANAAGAGTTTTLAHALAQEICRPDFRGCPFINAAAEYPDAEHPVREVVTRFRAWMTQTIAAALAVRDVADADGVARHIMMMRDGALVEGYVDGHPDRVAAELEKGVAALVAAA
ncbi:TetR/AcrR family transcriptional regulator [Demequina activiva]|uniref:TetR family transcriptional regulator n=1 Tax=Demequina activiva TaxID=1582364 RepID=A0A919Q266_9MICO|nr:TetR/AcrR family transcriptional regulator [Demequina activiva]GIG54664.1 TetR family transcriptional regulator [Demequina activiva]